MKFPFRLSSPARCLDLRFFNLPCGSFGIAVYEVSFPFSTLPCGSFGIAVCEVSFPFSTLPCGSFGIAVYEVSFPFSTLPCGSFGIAVCEVSLPKGITLLQRSNMSIATIQRDLSAPAERYVFQHIARRWRARSCASRFL